MSLPFNIMPNESGEADSNELLAKSILMRISCVVVGVIQSFNAQLQTASVKIAYRRSKFTQDSLGNLREVLVPFADVEDVPVVILRGGLASLQLPVKEGDECLLLISDRDIDNWYETGNAELGCKTLRLHNLTDSFALVGVTSKIKAFQNYPTDRARLAWDASAEVFVKDKNAGVKAGDTEVAANDTKIVFKNADTTLKTQLNALIDQLTTLNGHLQTLVAQTAAITVSYTDDGSPAVSGPPTNAAAITPVGTQIGNVTTQLGNIKTALGGLLA